MAKSAEGRPLSFHGEGGTLFGIYVVNLFLTLVTFGIYSFWGRVKVRNYIWGQIEFEGDRLSYHGTAIETLKGWMKAAVFFGIPYVVFRYVPQWSGAGPLWIALGGLGSLLLILVFIPMAIVGVRRYRMSRTSWRGIRFSFREHWKNYLALAFQGNLLKFITLGLYTPYYDARRDHFLISNTYVGGRNFKYDGKGEDLFKTYLVAWILFLPTLGFSLFWYNVKHIRYYWIHTTFDKARFDCTITFGGMFALYLVNFILVMITLGFGYAWAQVRVLRYFSDNLNLHGPADFESLEQDAQTVNATGEELASFFDLDFDLG
jgi:uncharacterized membrane protein YjgN (DUF898 family)